MTIAGTGTLAYMPGPRGVTGAQQVARLGRPDRAARKCWRHRRAIISMRAFRRTARGIALDIRDQEEDIWIWDFTRMHTDAPHVRCESRSVPSLDAG